MLIFHAEFNDIQTDKRNTYRNKVAANKALGKTGSPPQGEGEDGDIEGEGESQLNRDGQPAAKKARRDPDDSTGADTSEVPDSYRMGDHTADEGEEEDEQGDEVEDEDEEGDHEGRLEVEEQLEDPGQQEAEDEALDNGEDSD
jgi:DNA polymerase epsilon subunit 3